MVRGRKHIPGVGRVLAGRGKDVLDVPVPRCNHTFDVNELKISNKQLQKQIDMTTKAMSSDYRMSQLFVQLQSQHENGSGSRSGAGEDDESSDDKDIDEDEEDTDIKKSRDEVSDASIAAKCSLPQKRLCVRKPFPLNGDIIDGCMQHGTINLNRVSGDSQLDQPAYIDHEGYPALSRKMCCYRTRYEQLTMGFDLLICFTVKRSRDRVSSASTATKCSLAQKRPCGILTGLPMSGGLEFGKWFRNKGTIHLSKYLRTYHVGDNVDAKVNDVVHKANLSGSAGKIRLRGSTSNGFGWEWFLLQQ
nr:hypothetical protein [Tanacetum cinerariifolium]